MTRTGQILKSACTHLKSACTHPHTYTHSFSHTERNFSHTHLHTLSLYLSLVLFSPSLFLSEHKTEDKGYIMQVRAIFRVGSRRLRTGGVAQLVRANKVWHPLHLYSVLLFAFFLNRNFPCITLPPISRECIRLRASNFKHRSAPWCQCFRFSSSTTGRSSFRRKTHQTPTV